MVSSKSKGLKTPSSEYLKVRKSSVESSASLSNTVGVLLSAYRQSTPTRLQMIDVYLVFCMLTGIAQFVYVLLVGTFPFNAFLAGFSSCVGSFVLAASLRKQTNPANKDDFEKSPGNISPERAFGDFVFGNVLLHLAVTHFLG